MKRERSRGTQNIEVEIVGVEIFWTYIKVKADTFVLFSENKNEKQLPTQLPTSSKRRPIYIIVILCNIYC
jgi:hypothetical protein